MVVMATVDRSGFSQKIHDQLVKTGCMFDLCPVTATTKDMQLHSIQHVQQLLAGGKWNHPIIPSVYDECWCMYFTQVIFLRGQGIHSLLARLGEHAGERLLHSWSDARLVA